MGLEFDDSIDKPLMSNGFNEETDEVEVEDIADIPVKVKVKAVVDIPDTFYVEEGVPSTSQQPQRKRVRPTRLQYF